MAFDFEDGTLQGWRNLSSSSGTSGYYDLSFAPVYVPGWSHTPSGLQLVGSYFLGEVPEANDSKPVNWSLWPAASSGIHRTLWVESPAFELDGTGALTYLGCGSMGPINPATHVRNMTLTNVPATAGTWGPESGNAVGTEGACVVALRRDDGRLVLERGFSGWGDNWASYTFTTNELAPFVNDGHAYTLDLIDALGGTGAWCAIDSVRIPGRRPSLRLRAVSDSTAPVLTLNWAPTSTGWTDTPFSVVLASDDLSRPSRDWTVVESVKTADGSTSVDIPISSNSLYLTIRQTNSSSQFPQPMSYGADIPMEIWAWDDNPLLQTKLCNITNGAQIAGDSLPWTGIRFRFCIPVEHDLVLCQADSTGNFQDVLWGPDSVMPQGSATNVYKVCDTVAPIDGKYYIKIAAWRNHRLVAKSIVQFEIVRADLWPGDGLLAVGSTNNFPPPASQGSPIQFQLWQWLSDTDTNLQRQLLVLTNGMKIPVSSLPRDGMYFRFAVPVAHTHVKCECYSSDSFDKLYWDSDITTIPPLYRCTVYPLPFQAGRYSLGAEARSNGVLVAKTTIEIELTQPPAARDTHYTQGRIDSANNGVTYSAPVVLGPLNQTTNLVDNDYPFAPQQAYHAVNWERFPPFQYPDRFVNVYGSRRFLDETNFGDALSRGFTSLAVVESAQDDLLIKQRNWFHTPDLQVNFINQWYGQDPARYADLKAYADYRSAWVSETNAWLLGWQCYSAWGAGGYQPYDPGLYGWDEEQMYQTIGIDMIRNHPNLVPASVLSHFVNDPQLTRPESQALAQSLYIQAWGDFVGNGYKGARACAAARGRVFKIWHYGSHAPGDALFLSPGDWAINPATGLRHADEFSTLWDWFKVGNRVSFEASEYARQIDYFHKDFYYHVVFPQSQTMYQKSGGQYVLDANGRRVIRTDVFTEKVYEPTIPIGYEDCEIAPVFLKTFIAKGENALYFLNGAKYYKQHGTLITHKGLIPALRPGNQETWGNTAQFGSRPISPYLAEAASIYTYLIGLEGLYLWDSHNYSALLGQGRAGNSTPATTDALGDVEYIVKGMHRVSQFGPLFDGDYSFVRPVCHYDTFNRDHPLIRGLINGRNLLLAMTNPYLDPGETETVELWYDAPYAQKSRIWSGSATLQSRKTRLLQCQLPALTNGGQYDPDKLYLRYTCVDGNYSKTYTVTGNYNVSYPY